MNMGWTTYLMVIQTFVVLKLTGVVSWSWWWVLSPLWAPTALLIVALVLLALVAIAISLLVRNRLPKDPPQEIAEVLNEKSVPSRIDGTTVH